VYSTAKVAFLVLCASGMASHSAADKAIDVERSTITVHVGKAGVFSIAGHEHWVSALISQGVLNDSDRPRVEFRVDTANMLVKRDSNIDAKTQAEIQKNMQEITLESAKYPEITFRSSHVEKLADGQWKVAGVLTLHGVSKPLAVVVKQTEDTYVGHATIMQTDFGIKPIRVGGGMVKVRNELEIEFRIVTRPG
jgi:polyisoprenoid-binding protein YceI